MMNKEKQVSDDPFVCEIMARIDNIKTQAFLLGKHSHDDEIAALKAEIERYKNALNKIAYPVVVQKIDIKSGLLQELDTKHWITKEGPAGTWRYCPEEEPKYYIEIAKQALSENE